MNKVVGVTIDTKSVNTKKKIYYYKTNENYNRGDNIRIKVQSGGTPRATVVIKNSNKKQSINIKDLKEVWQI